MAEIKFDILETFGVISESPKGWKKELKLVSWNDKDTKYDIREWSPNYDRMGKGLTFTKEELKALRDVLKNIDL
ncbi:PC4/YdbC family ssDNA-binding protein [Thermodesulfobium sp. 4217-1]|uniref:YdbC family protein n=1 Tax=Thermodesulfobium sp. 4217-1 TaxID=3120013 RepID=UPI003221B9FC